MTNTWFCSDHHFGHANIITFKDKNGELIRPFSSIEEHDETIIENHNKLVKPEDRVYMMGDLAIHRRNIPMVDRLNGRKKLLRGNHDCLDAETEALTKRGWTPHTQLKVGDYVWSLNPVTKLGEWKLIEEVLTRHSDSIYAFNGQAVDMAVTGNHRVAYLNSTGNIDYFIPEGRIPSIYKIPTAAKSSNNETTSDLTQDELSLLAWVYTDGSLQYYKGVPRTFVIYQSKKDGVDRITTLLDRLEIEYTVSKRSKKTHVMGKKLLSCLDPYQFYVSWGSAEKYMGFLGDKKALVDKLIFGLSDEDAMHFLRGLMDGDGSWASNGLLQSGALHGRKEFLESVQRLAVTCGVQAYLTVARAKDYRLNLNFRSTNQIFSSSNKRTGAWGFKPKRYSGDVWCIVTEHTNFMVRRNGKAYFTGNCFRLKDYAPYFDDIDAYRMYPEQGIIVSHIPIHPSQLEWRFKFNVHGHLHSNIVTKDVPKVVEIDCRGGPFYDIAHEVVPDERYINLCLEHTNFKPVSFDEICEKIGWEKNK